MRFINDHIKQSIRSSYATHPDLNQMAAGLGISRRQLIAAASRMGVKRGADAFGRTMAEIARAAAMHRNAGLVPRDNELRRLYSDSGDLSSLAESLGFPSVRSMCSRASKLGIKRSGRVQRKTYRERTKPFVAKIPARHVAFDHTRIPPKITSAPQGGILGVWGEIVKFLDAASRHGCFLSAVASLASELSVDGIFIRNRYMRGVMA